jgi:hypothetical protein
MQESTCFAFRHPPNLKITADRRRYLTDTFISTSIRMVTLAKSIHHSITVQIYPPKKVYGSRYSTILSLVEKKSNAIKPLASWKTVTNRYFGSQKRLVFNLARVFYYSLIYTSNSLIIFYKQNYHDSLVRTVRRHTDIKKGLSNVHLHLIVAGCIMVDVNSSPDIVDDAGLFIQRVLKCCS